MNKINNYEYIVLLEDIHNPYFNPKYAFSMFKQDIDFTKYIVFNKDIDLKDYNNLTYFCLEYYTKNIDLSNNINLTHLCLDIYIRSYNKELNNLPNSIEYLELKKYNLKIKKIPKNLKTLKCDKDYKYIDDFKDYKVICNY